MRDVATTAFLVIGLGQKAAEAGEAIRSYSVEKKDEAVAHAKRLAADLDARIKELETRAAKETGEAKARAQGQLKELRAKRAGPGQGRLSQRLPRPGHGLRPGGGRAQEIVPA